MKHKHHVIPKHAGGTDDPSNIVELTIEEHAEAHRKLYEEHGRWQDRIAWHALSGIIGHKEAWYQKICEASKMAREKIAEMYTSEDRSRWRKNAWENATEEQREKHRQAVSKGRTGIKLSEEHRQAMSERMTGEGHPLWGVPWDEERLWITNGQENRRINPEKEQLPDGWWWAKTVFNPRTDYPVGEENHFYGKKHKQSSKDLISKANSGLNNGSLKKSRENNILYKEPYLSEILEMRREGLGKIKMKKIMDEKYPELENIPKHQYYTTYKSIEKYGVENVQ